MRGPNDTTALQMEYPNVVRDVTGPIWISLYDEDRVARPRRLAGRRVRPAARVRRVDGLRQPLVHARRRELRDDRPGAPALLTHAAQRRSRGSASAPTTSRGEAVYWACMKPARRDS